MERVNEESDNSTGGRSQLPNDVIETIFRRLPVIDLVRTKVLSKFWKAFAESLLSWRLRESPLLILPPQRDKERNSFTNYSSDVVHRCRLVNLRENMAYALKKTTSDVLLNVPCVGSSHGWLILSNFMTLTPTLFNPFTEQKIELPSFKSLLDISMMEETDDPLKYRCLMKNKWRDMTFLEVFQSFVTKVILTADPSTTFGVVLKCSYGKDMLFYYKKGDPSWKKFFTLGLKYGPLEDIICNGNCIYVLEEEHGWIYTWDLQNGYPEKRVVIKPATLSRETLLEGIDIDGWAQNYLVELNGEILLVSRFISTEPIGKSDNTLMFNIFKLDSEKKEWLKVTTIGHATSLFVGKNHFMSISTKGSEALQGNCIYFTNDPLNLLFYDWSGRDMGIYNLSGGKNVNEVKRILQVPLDFVFWPKPCWLFLSH